MQRMELLLKLTPADQVRSDVLPMVFRALESDAQQIQELCLTVLPTFAGLIDYPAMKNQLLPRIKRLCIGTSFLSVSFASTLFFDQSYHSINLRQNFSYRVTPFFAKPRRAYNAIRITAKFLFSSQFQSLILSPLKYLFLRLSYTCDVKLKE